MCHTDDHKSPVGFDRCHYSIVSAIVFLCTFLVEMVNACVGKQQGMDMLVWSWEGCPWRLFACLNAAPSSNMSPAMNLKGVLPQRILQTSPGTHWMSACHICNTLLHYFRWSCWCISCLSLLPYICCKFVAWTSCCLCSVAVPVNQLCCSLWLQDWLMDDVSNETALTSFIIWVSSWHSWACSSHESWKLRRSATSCPFSHGKS